MSTIDARMENGLAEGQRARRSTRYHQPSGADRLMPPRRFGEQGWHSFKVPPSAAPQVKTKARGIRYRRVRAWHAGARV